MDVVIANGDAFDVLDLPEADAGLVCHRPPYAMPGWEDTPHLPVFGHLGDFASYNPRVREDVAAWAARFADRPTFEDAHVGT